MNWSWNAMNTEENPFPPPGEVLALPPSSRTYPSNVQLRSSDGISPRAQGLLSARETLSWVPSGPTYRLVPQNLPFNIPSIRAGHQGHYQDRQHQCANAYTSSLRHTLLSPTNYPPPAPRPAHRPLEPLSPYMTTIPRSLAYPSTMQFDLASPPRRGQPLQLRAELETIPSPPVRVCIEFPCGKTLKIEIRANAVLEVMDEIHNTLHDTACVQYECLPHALQKRVYSYFKRRLAEYENGLNHHDLVWSREGPKKVDLLCGTTQFMGLSPMEQGIWKLIVCKPGEKCC